MMNKSCANCSHFDPTQKQDFANFDLGFCRRHAPRVGVPKVNCDWPIVQETDWCGEFCPTPDAISRAVEANASADQALSNRIVGLDNLALKEAWLDGYRSGQEFERSQSR
jgi:hypothetical protein